MDLFLVQIIRNRPQFFAYELKNSIKVKSCNIQFLQINFLFKGTITNIDNLNRITVSRCEIDMVQIKSEYEKLVKRTLYDHIQVCLRNKIYHFNNFVSFSSDGYKWKL